LKLLEMPPDQIVKLVDGIVGLVDFLSKTPENLLGFVVEKLNQDIVLILKI